MTNYRTCSKCKVDKPINKFNKARSECVECRKMYNNTHYEKTKNKMIKCDCGKEIKYSNRYEHKKSKKHIKLLGKLNENKT